MGQKEIALIVCLIALFIIGVIVFSIVRSNKRADVESILELGVIILDLLTSILSGL